MLLHTRIGEQNLESLNLSLIGPIHLLLTECGNPSLAIIPLIRSYFVLMNFNCFLFCPSYYPLILFLIFFFFANLLTEALRSSAIFESDERVKGSVNQIPCNSN